MKSEAGQATSRDKAIGTTKRHVLVVDDEPYICIALRQILETEGHRVTTVSAGGTELEVVAEDLRDVVLLDILMPRMDGRETCRRIRALSTTVKVIYLTGKADAYKRSDVRELLAEADGLIAKPATKLEILEAVRSVLSMDG